MFAKSSIPGLKESSDILPSNLCNEEETNKKENSQDGSSDNPTKINNENVSNHIKNNN